MSTQIRYRPSQVAICGRNCSRKPLRKVLKFYKIVSIHLVTDPLLGIGKLRTTVYYSDANKVTNKQNSQQSKHCETSVNGRHLAKKEDESTPKSIIMSEQRTDAPPTQDEREIAITLKEGPDDSARSPVNAAAREDGGTSTNTESASLSQLVSNGSFNVKVVIKDQASPGGDSSTLENMATNTSTAPSLDEHLQGDRQEPTSFSASQPSIMANQTTAAPPPPQPSSSSSSTTSSDGESGHTDDEGGETATATSVSLSASAGAVVRSPVQVVASSTTPTTTDSVVTDGKLLAEGHATSTATIPARKEDPPGEMAAVATGTKEQEAEVAAPKVVQVPAVASPVDSVQDTISTAEPNIVVAEEGETKTSEDATREATSSASPSTISTTPFVNQGLALWERARQEWLGSTQSSSSSSTATTMTTPTAAATPLDVDEIIDIIFASTRQQVVREVAAAAAASPTAASTTTTTSSSVSILQVEPPRSFPKPVPLPQMIDILVDLWYVYYLACWLKWLWSKSTNELRVLECASQRDLGSWAKRCSMSSAGARILLIHLLFFDCN